MIISKYSDERYALLKVIDSSIGKAINLHVGNINHVTTFFNVLIFQNHVKSGIPINELAKDYLFVDLVKREVVYSFNEQYPEGSYY